RRVNLASIARLPSLNVVFFREFATEKRDAGTGAPAGRDHNISLSQGEARRENGDRLLPIRQTGPEIRWLLR
ncbi:hypothetical protein ABH309_19245, partial [Chromobacterium piscinae]